MTDIWFSRPVEVSRSNVARLQAMGVTRTAVGRIAVARNTLTLWKCKSVSADSSVWEPLVGDWEARAFGSELTRSVIQLALDSCAAAGGGIVQLPAGEFDASDGVSIPARVTLVGKGRATRLLGPASPSSGQAVITVAGDHASVRDLAVEVRADGSPVSYGILIGDADVVRIERVTFAPYTGAEVVNHAIRSLSGVVHDDLEIVDVRVEACTSNEAIYLEGDADGYRIERVKVIASGDDSIRLRGTKKDGRIRDNRIRSTSGRGITLGDESALDPHPSQWNLIEGNVVRDGSGVSPDAGIFATGQGLVVAGNMIDGYTGDAIHTKARQGITALNVVRNVAVWEGAIKGKGTERTQVSSNSPGYGHLFLGNTIYGVTGTFGRGIYTSGGETLVSSNVVEGARLCGIEFQEGTGSNVAVGNRIRNITGNVGAIRQHGAGRGVMVGNMITEIDNPTTAGAINWRNAVGGTFSYMVASGNLFDGNLVQFGAWDNYAINGDNVTGVPDE